MDFLRRLAIVFASTHIVIFMSEHLFWSNPGSGWNTILEHIYPSAAIFYFPATYSFLCVVYWFRVRSFFAIFLAGAVFGWLIEGVAVSTTYDDLPTSISVTGLSWHALLSIGVMWYLARRVLIERSPLKTALLATGIGVYWAAWGVWWWINDGRVAPLRLWLPYTFVLSAALILAYWILSRVPGRSFRPTRIEGLLLALFNVVIFALAVVPKKPIALIVLPSLLAVVFLVLWKNRKSEDLPNAFILLDGKIPLANLGMLLLIPVVATLLYAFLLALPFAIKTGPVIYVAEEILGFLFMAVCIIRVLARKPSSHGNTAS